MLPPASEERGFEDTVKANPGYFTTIRPKFEQLSGVVAPQTYIHHCHIVEHEDNDMMRPFIVVAQKEARWWSGRAFFIVGARRACQRFASVAWSMHPLIACRC